jgi:hypothetical protein
MEDEIIREREPKTKGQWNKRGAQHLFGLCEDVYKRTKKKKVTIESSLQSKLGLVTTSCRGVENGMGRRKRRAGSVGRSGASSSLDVEMISLERGRRTRGEEIGPDEKVRGQGQEVLWFASSEQPPTLPGEWMMRRQNKS